MTQGVAQYFGGFFRWGRHSCLSEFGSVGHSCPTERTRMARMDRNVHRSPFEADKNVCSTNANSPRKRVTPKYSRRGKQELRSNQSENIRQIQVIILKSRL